MHPREHQLVRGDGGLDHAGPCLFQLALLDAPESRGGLQLRRCRPRGDWGGHGDGHLIRKGSWSRRWWTRSLRVSLRSMMTSMRPPEISFESALSAFSRKVKRSSQSVCVCVRGAGVVSDSVHALCVWIWGEALDGGCVPTSSTTHPCKYISTVQYMYIVGYSGRCGLHFRWR